MNIDERHTELAVRRTLELCRSPSPTGFTREAAELIEKAPRALCDYTVGIYPSYGSDADVAPFAGHEVRHGLIGPGVYTSHGYERTRRDGEHARAHFRVALPLKPARFSRGPRTFEGLSHSAALAKIASAVLTRDRRENDERFERRKAHSGPQ